MKIFGKKKVTATTTVSMKATTTIHEESNHGQDNLGLGLEDTQRREGEKRIYNLIILDESGSMSGIYEQALSGANETINTIRNAQRDDPEVTQLLTFVTFDSGSSRPDVRAIINNKPIDEVKDITRDDYRPNGCTPLYDAMGISISELQKVVKEGDNVLVTVITDGYENSSHIYSASMVKELVEALRAKGWVFTYIGANQSSVEVAGGLGIHNAMDFRQDDEGTRMMWEKMNSSRRAYYSKARRMRETGVFEDLEEDFFAEKQQAKRITPEHVGTLSPGQVLVFGSNTQGNHAGGLARFALENLGAVMGQAEGPQGRSYAIPTVGLDLEQIREAVFRFIMYAEAHGDVQFLVTRIGCGHAGFSPKEIAPMFAGALALENVSLPEDFWTVINYRYSR